MQNLHFFKKKLQAALLLQSLGFACFIPTKFLQEVLLAELLHSFLVG